ncbi:MAG: hypothetical protein DWG83_01830 [Chloroflexi bacterium]|nr:hypothetical protein [Chloroflexota bacterium]MQC19297.1 hypothetical protein [Chloroflexota bacterium]
MARVRLDENGVPKGAVVEQVAAALHRSGVDGVDEGDPVSPSDGVDASGFAFVDFDLDVALGGDDPLLEVTPLFFDGVAEAWFRGPPSFFVESGRFRVRVEARGAVVFLAVTALEGDEPTLDLDVWASVS